MDTVLKSDAFEKPAGDKINPNSELLGILDQQLHFLLEKQEIAAFPKLSSFLLITDFYLEVLKTAFPSERQEKFSLRRQLSSFATDIFIQRNPQFQTNTEHDSAFVLPIPMIVTAERILGGANVLEIRILDLSATFSTRSNYSSRVYTALVPPYLLTYNLRTKAYETAVLNGDSLPKSSSLTQLLVNAQALCIQSEPTNEPYEPLGCNGDPYAVELL